MAEGSQMGEAEILSVVGESHLTEWSHAILCNCPESFRVKLWLTNQPARPPDYLFEGVFIFKRFKRLLNQHTKQKDRIDSIKAR